MSIELLLSMHQGQGAVSSSHSPTPGAARTAPSGFFQALTQAVHQQARLSSPQTDGTSIDALNAVSEQLASLDIELDEETLESVLNNVRESARENVSTPPQAAEQTPANRQGTQPPLGAERLTLNQPQEVALDRSYQPREQPASSDTRQGAEATTLSAAMTEVASRLALIASYSEAPATPAQSQMQSHGQNTAMPSTPAFVNAAPVIPTNPAAVARPTSLDSQQRPNEAAPAPAAFLGRTTLPMSAMLSENAVVAAVPSGVQPATQAKPAIAQASQPSVVQQPVPATPSATPRDAHAVAASGERVAAAQVTTPTAQPTEHPVTRAQPTAPQTTAQAPQQPVAQAPQPQPTAPARAPATASVTPPPADRPAALQAAPASATPRDAQAVAASGERVAVAQVTTPTAQPTAQTPQLIPAPLATHLANPTRPAPSTNALPAEATTATSANTSALATSQEATTVVQPLVTTPPGMHALSPLNTALTPVSPVNAEAIASAIADTEAASATSNTAKGNEQPLPASLTSQQPTAPNSLAATTLNTPVTSPAWPSQLGQQLIQFAQRGGEHQVKMQLHPAELGPLSITLKVTDQGAQAHFLSSHATVRQVIEQAIPQLREALAEQGISLGETSVGEQQTSNEQAFAQQMPGQAAGDRHSEAGSDSALPTEVSAHSVQDGRVDLYA